MIFFHASLLSSLSSRIVCCLVVKLCPTLCNPMDYSPPGASVHGMFQARILEWVAISSSRGSSRPRDWTASLALAGRFFHHWATTEYSSLKVSGVGDIQEGAPRGYSGFPERTWGHVRKMSWTRVLTAWRWEGARVLRPKGRKQTCLGHRTVGFTLHTRKAVARCPTDPRQ